MQEKVIKTMLMIAIMLPVSLLSMNALGEDTALSNLQKKQKIKIDIVSDVVCPWCAIGYKRLSTAISELEIEGEVDIEWHPFELNPNMPTTGKNANKYLMDKYNLNKSELVQTRNRVTNLGQKTGFKFDYFSDMMKLNTFNAHILLDYAQEFGKQTELEVRLTEAYFSERKDINNREVLLLELEAVGLDGHEAIARLDDDKAILNVKKEEKYWKEFGVTSIPTIIFDNSLVRVGADKTDIYKKILTVLLEDK